MKRRIPRIFALLAAILAVLAALLWLRSASREDHISFAAANRRFWVGSARHHVWLRAAISMERRLTAEAHLDRDIGDQPKDIALPQYDKAMLSRTIRVPYWLIILACAIPAAVLGAYSRRSPPAHQARRPRRRRRKRDRQA